MSDEEKKNDAKPPAETNAGASAKPAGGGGGGGGDAPRPQPFAVMRNTHEAFRQGIKLMVADLESDEAGRVKKFAKKWRMYQRALHVHLVMEDKGMFPLLSEIDLEKMKEAHLEDEHVQDHKYGDAVFEALAAKGLSKTDKREKIRTAFAQWKEYHLNHLAHEEQVMMPLTVKSGATPQERSDVFRNRILQEAKPPKEFKYMVKYVIRMLCEFGSTGQQPEVACRVFVWGLQYASTPTEWKARLKWVKKYAKPAIYQDMVSNFQINEPGKATEK